MNLPLRNNLAPNVAALLLGCVLSCSSVLLGQTQKSSDTLPPCPAEYLMGGILASDGTVWVASEGDGVYRLWLTKEKGNQQQEKWLSGTYYQGFPDTVNVYALAEDKQGRIWAGTDNQGVAVFNGVDWKTYNRENAILGERVFDIAVSDKTGEVAIATSGGVSIYNPANETWIDLTRAEGLTEDQVEALTYDRDGILWLAYQCGGVTRISPRDGYKHMEHTQAPWYWDKNQYVRQPLDSAGKGLPSNLCNAILAGKDGRIWVGTTSGLAVRTSNGDWRYIRGEDYQDKNKGLYQADKMTFPDTGKGELPEDFVTCLAETDEGLWTGYRQKGTALLNPGALKIIKAGQLKGKDNNWATALITLPDGATYATTYGRGFQKIDDGKGKAKLTIVQRNQHPQHPTPPKVKSLEQIAAEVKKLEGMKEDSDNPPAVFWKEDWSTRGNWCERYGTHHALLCGSNAPMSDEFDFTIEQITEIGARIGANRQNAKGFLVDLLQQDYPEDVNILYNPETATRTSSYWFDGGQNYSQYLDGPDLWIVVNVPEGFNEVSFYFYNYNAQDISGDSNSDFLIEARKYNSSLSEKLTFKKSGISEKSGIDNIYCREDETSAILKEPVFARTRVKTCGGSGVYKSFLASGPSRIYFRIAKNYSYETFLGGIFTNQINSKDGSIVERSDISFVYGIELFPEKISADEREKNKKYLKIWENLSSPRLFPKIMSQKSSLLLELYRLFNSMNQVPAITANWKYSLRMFELDEVENFDEKLLSSWYAKQEARRVFRSRVFFPFSPRTIQFTPKEISLIEALGIDWKDYLPNSKKSPALSPDEIKEKASVLSDEEINQILIKRLNKKQ